ncbi:MAG: DUF2271 domain-containing protein [Bryobacterales bacterium]|nr:DUF2271 domain-containing protein [Bryobacterales bacterium]
MKLVLPSAALSGLLMTSARALHAADLEVSVEIPQLKVAEYHRPYGAIWIEKNDQAFAGNLAVWYQLRDSEKGEKGSTWLKDLRTWWRKSGRDLTLPVDGVSGATRPPGAHRLTFKGSRAALAALAPGEYQLVVEMAREVGGREIVRIPFKWPAGGAPAQAQGAHEIGQVQVIVKP